MNLRPLHFPTTGELFSEHERGSRRTALYGWRVYLTDCGRFTLERTAAGWRARGRTHPAMWDSWLEATGIAGTSFSRRGELLDVLEQMLRRDGLIDRDAL